MPIYFMLCPALLIARASRARRSHARLPQAHGIPPQRRTPAPLLLYPTPAQRARGSFAQFPAAAVSRDCVQLLRRRAGSPRSRSAWLAARLPPQSRQAQTLLWASARAPCVRAAGHAESRRLPASGSCAASAPVALLLLIYEWTGPAVPQTPRLRRLEVTVRLWLGKPGQTECASCVA